MSKNINLKNNISSSYFNKISYRKDKIKLKRIINEILFSIDNERDVFHSFSKKFKFNFKYSEIKKFSKYQSIILIGMGGSALGAKAIYTFCNNKKNRFSETLLIMPSQDPTIRCLRICWDSAPQNS